VGGSLVGWTKGLGASRRGGVERTRRLRSEEGGESLSKSYAQFYEANGLVLSVSPQLLLILLRLTIVTRWHRLDKIMPV